MYGQIGVDIYEGKEKVTILSKKENLKPAKLWNKFKEALGFKSKHDYEEKDTLGDVLMKYVYNKKHRKEADIENMFGEKGMEQFNKYKAMGYVI